MMHCQPSIKTKISVQLANCRIAFMQILLTMSQSGFFPAL